MRAWMAGRLHVLRVRLIQRRLERSLIQMACPRLEVWAAGHMAPFTWRRCLRTRPRYEYAATDHADALGALLKHAFANRPVRTLPHTQYTDRSLR